MKIKYNNICFFLYFRQNFLNCQKWASNWRHEHFALCIYDCHFYSIFLYNCVSVSRCFLCKINRSNQIFLLINIRINFSLIPAMISQSYDIYTSFKHFLRNFHIYSKSASRIFSIYNNKIIILPSFFQIFKQRISARSSNNIPNY